METRRILVLLDCGFSVSNIQKRLMEEQIYVSKVAIYQLIKKYKEHHIYIDLPKLPAQKPILNEEQVRYIDNAMANNELGRCMLFCFRGGLT